LGVPTAAYLFSQNYANGFQIRQQILETVLDCGDIRVYISKSRHRQNANELWAYLQNMVNWVPLAFTVYLKEK